MMQKVFRFLFVLVVGLFVGVGALEVVRGEISVIASNDIITTRSNSTDAQVFIPIVMSPFNNQVTNGKLTLDLQFMGQVLLPNGQPVDWTNDLKQPYVNAANKWLSALVGIEGKEDNHTIVVKIRVQPLSDSNGQAGPTEDEEIGQFTFPTEGEMEIASHTYADDFDQVEFNANIVHELGHIIGLGFYTEPYTTLDASTNGNAFRGPGTNRGVELYNQIYGTTTHFVPISDDRGHLYDSVEAEDQPRQLPDGSALPSMTKEIMAHGTVFGSVALGVLDDIGYIIDYSAAESYVP